MRSRQMYVNISLLLPSLVRFLSRSVAFPVPKEYGSCSNPINQTPVGMTGVFIHENPTIFPEPFQFRPERWLEKRPDGAPPLDKYLVTFTKGSRMCIGIK